MTCLHFPIIILLSFLMSNVICILIKYINLIFYY